jgi:hypothetical protein
VVSFRTRPLYPWEKNPGTQWVGRWVGPRTDLDLVTKRKILPCRESNPGFSAHSPVTVLNLKYFLMWWIILAPDRINSFATTDLYLQYYICISNKWTSGLVRYEKCRRTYSEIATALVLTYKCKCYWQLYKNATFLYTCDEFVSYQMRMETPLVHLKEDYRNSEIGFFHFLREADIIVY